VGGAALTIFIYARTGEIIPRISRADLKVVMIKSICAEVISPVILFIALGYTEAAHVSLINSFEITATFIFASLLFKEALGGTKLIGMILIVIGVSAITYNNGTVNVGDLLIFISATLFGLDNAYTIRLSDKISSECVMQLKFLIGAAVLGILAVLTGAHGYQSIGLVNSMLIIYTALIPLSVCMVMLTNAYRVLGANTTESVFALTIPLGPIFAIIALGEQINLGLLAVSSGILMAGVYITGRMNK
jgi:drug/metabolite transporter (DMT)-like permease